MTKLTDSVDVTDQEGEMTEMTPINHATTSKPTSSRNYSKKVPVGKR
jgi:hypothetical protein